MSDIRMPETDISVGGKTYRVACNMNVLADIQAAADGDFASVLNRNRSLRSALIIGAALINEANDAAGDPERVTPSELGRRIRPAEANDFAAACINLVYRALAGDGDDEPETTETETEKN